MELAKTKNVHLKKCCDNGTSHKFYNYMREGCIFMADGFFFIICSHNLIVFPQIAL